MTTRPVIALAAALVLAGCAGTVRVEDPAPGAEGASVCAAVLADLPEQVLDQSRREVEPGVLSAAWGKPPITLRCGVDAPSALTPSSECFEVNGVGWFAEPASGGYLFTTIGRTTYVEVGVPSDYAPEANVLTDVAASISAHDPLLTPCR